MDSPSYSSSISKMKIAKRFLTLIVCLGCLLGTPCSSRPIVPLGDVSAGVREKSNNASMVVRIIVSSSSSSSSADSDFSHFFPISTSSSTSTLASADASSSTSTDTSTNLHSHRLDHDSKDGLQEFEEFNEALRNNPRNNILGSQSQSFLIDTTTNHSLRGGSRNTNINANTNQNAKSQPTSKPASKSTFTSDSNANFTTPSESDLPVRTSTSSSSSTSTSTPTPTMSSSSLSSNLKYPFLSVLPSTPNPVPTTYRPKSFRFRSSPLFLSLFLSSNTTTTSPVTTTTTIKPLPFREDIFSIFYRAFSESQDSIQQQSNSHPNPSQGSSSSFINNLQSHKQNIPKINSNYNNHNYEMSFSPQHQQQHQQQLPPELIVGGSSSRNVERFQILPSPRIVPSNRDRDRNLYRNINTKNNNNNYGDAKNEPNIPNKSKLQDPENGPSNNDEKIVTAVVTRSSSSSVSASVIGSANPINVNNINANYPRIRPSSVMMLRLRGTTNSNSASPLDEISVSGENVTIAILNDFTNQTNESQKTNDNDNNGSGDDEQNENAETDLQLQIQLQQAADIANATTIIDWSSKERHMMKEWHDLNTMNVSQSQSEIDSSVIKNAKISNNRVYDSHSNNSPNAPQAEALIQTPADNEEAVNAQSLIGSESEKPEVTTTTATTTVASNLNWKIPEKNWSEPSKVWGVPSKVWSEPAKVWGQPSKVWSKAPTTTTPRIEVETVIGVLQQDIQNQDRNETTQENLQNEGNKADQEAEEDDETPKGTFYVLGDDEDAETPPQDIPSEFSTKSSSSSSWELPEITPQVDHSFIEPPSRSAEVPESLEAALRSHSHSQSQKDFRFSSNIQQAKAQSSSNTNSNSRTSTSRIQFDSQSQNQNQNQNQHREIIQHFKTMAQTQTQTQTLSQRQRQNYHNSEYNNRNQNRNINNHNHNNPNLDSNSKTNGNEERENSGKKFGYVLDGNDVRKYRVEERTSDGYIVGEYGVLNNNNGFLRGVRYTADGTINPRLIHEALMKFLAL